MHTTGRELGGNQRFCDAMKALVQKWENDDYDGASNGPTDRASEYQVLQKQLPEIYEILITERDF